VPGTGFVSVPVNDLILFLMSPRSTLQVLWFHWQITSSYSASHSTRQPPVNGQACERSQSCMLLSSTCTATH
jgi:hypothetical protein